jgi:hypothetical protein
MSIKFHCSPEKSSFQNVICEMLSGSEIITGVAVLQTVPLRHAGAKGDRMYSSYSFLASAIDSLKLRVNLNKGPL